MTPAQPAPEGPRRLRRWTALAALPVLIALLASATLLTLQEKAQGSRELATTAVHLQSQTNQLAAVARDAVFDVGDERRAAVDEFGEAYREMLSTLDSMRRRDRASARPQQCARNMGATSRGCPGCSKPSDGRTRPGSSAAMSEPI